MEKSESVLTRCFVAILCATSVIGCTFTSSESRTTVYTSKSDSSGFSIETDSLSSIASSASFAASSIRDSIRMNVRVVKLGHHINTPLSEYNPCPTSDGGLVFSGMDRTGFFDYQIDFTQNQNAGGEDIFKSQMNSGLFDDARPLADFNTNAHEVITQVLSGNRYLVVGNYSENMGPKGDNAGVLTPDIFLFKKSGEKFRAMHLPEPVNSMYGEYDAYMPDENTILFASDRPGAVGEYHKKGWRWNENLWGNTDIYVSVKQGDFWSNPISLGSSVNTGAAERSPYLTPDGKKLYVASNGFRTGRFDLDIYEYRRVNASDWTMWDGPYLVSELSSPGDDWFYRESNDGSTAYFSRSTPLPYKSSLPTRDGDGHIRETNFRTGYVVEGAQSAALNKEYQTDIYQIVREQSPAVILPDLLFEFNADRLSSKASPTLERLWDFIGQNTFTRIVIEGHTDNVGQSGYNRDLSTRRAESVGKFLLEQGLPAEKIKTIGFGDTQPRFDNGSKEGRDKNRRVEIRFE